MASAPAGPLSTDARLISKLLELQPFRLWDRHNPVATRQLGPL